MSNTLNADASSHAPGGLALTPEALTSLLRISAPGGPVTVKGITSEVRYWPKTGTPTKIYGRLSLGDSSIRFELQPHALVQDNNPVVLHGSLRVKPSEGYRTTHEVVLIGDVQGAWIPREISSGMSRELERTRARATIERILEVYGLKAVGYLVTKTAWEDLTNAATAITVVVY